MNHSALTQANLRSWRWNTLTASAGLLIALSHAASTHAQSTAAPIHVSLNSAAYLPQISEGSIHTAIATGLGEIPSATSPWRVALLHLGRTSSGEKYTIQLTNISAKPLNLPVGTNGKTIWSACQNASIAEINIALRVAGEPSPAAYLPSAHSCVALSSSFVKVQPGASVLFQGTLAEPLTGSDGAEFSAEVSICSARYGLEGRDPVTTRSCQVPATSTLVSQSEPIGRLPEQPRVK